MTELQATGIKRTCSIASAGAAVAAVGMLAAVPAAIAVGLLVGCGGGFVTLIAFVEAAS